MVEIGKTWVEPRFSDAVLQGAFLVFTTKQKRALASK